MKTLLIVLPLLALAGGSSSLAERQLAHPWGRWQVGAWVQTESTNTSHVGGALVEREQLTGRTEATYELTSALLAESGDVESTFDNSWALGGHAYALGSGQQIGTETLTVEGRAHECEVWEARWQNNGQPVVERTWVSDAFDFPVRSVTRGAGIQLDVAIARKSDFVLVKGRKLPCVRLEGRGQVGGSRVELVLWMSPHIPGGAVRRETRLASPEGPRLLVKQVTEYHGELARKR